MEQTAGDNVERLNARLFDAVLGMFDIFSVYLGDKLGLYEAVASRGSVTAATLAEATSTDPRYIREWLEQQAVTGFLAVIDATESAEARRFRLPPGHADVLADRENLSYLAPLAQIAVGAVFPLEELVAAYRSGAGVPYDRYGIDLREGQARINRNSFLYQLGQEYFPRIPDLHARLSALPPARIADLGCGLGWSSVAMAAAYPAVTVDGFDLDVASVEEAQDVVAASGAGDRVRVLLKDAADPALAGRYDLVTAFECVHDMSDPVGALRTMRRLMAPGGTVLIVDEKAADAFDPHAGDTERSFYGWSILHCLPVGRIGDGAAATGAVMRPSTLANYASEAGFGSFEVLSLDHPSFHFYKLGD